MERSGAASSGLRSAATREDGAPERRVATGTMYGEDVLKTDLRSGRNRRRVVPEVDAEPDLVVEDAESGFCGAVVGFESGAVVLEDRFGKRRNFPLAPAGFL